MRATSITILVGLLGLTRVSMALAIDVASFTILSSTNNAQLEKHYSSVPNFSLVERSGKKITLADLRGRIWIADFIYTNCADTCPLQTADMAKLQERWVHESDVELVSFSVDPGRDTPRVLAKYADRFKADPKRWLFLTGEREEIARLVEDGFRLAVAPATRGNHEIIIHSPRCSDAASVAIRLIAIRRRCNGSKTTLPLCSRINGGRATLVRQQVRAADRCRKRTNER